MTKLSVWFFILSLVVSVSGQSFQIDTGEGITKKFYNLMSGDAGQKSDKETLRKLFLQDANIVLMGKNSLTNIFETKVFSVEDYMKSIETDLNKGFWMTETESKLQNSENLTHIFSKFEVRRRQDDKLPFLFGLNSFQLRFDGKHWQIISIYQQIKKVDSLRRQQGFMEYATHDIADVTDIILSKNQIILNCSTEKTINVSTKATNENHDQLLYNYTTDGGKIIGNGEKVIWDLTGAKPGTYTITAATDNGCGLCGTTVTKTVTVVETGDCPNP
jgi:hypothetical protein